MSELIWSEVPDGFHINEMSTYLGWCRVSASTINETRPDRSMAWVRNCLMGGNHSEDTAARILGSVTHTAVFEPDTFESSYVVEPFADPAVYTTDDGKPSSNPRQTKKWKAMLAELEGDGKRKVISQEAFRAGMSMRDAVYAHKRASELLSRAAGPVEISAAAVLDVADVGVPVKIRPDKLNAPLGINVQFKTSRNAHPNAFMWDAWKFGHFYGAEFYGKVLKALDWECRKTVFIVAQTEGNLPEIATFEPDSGAASAAEDLVNYRLLKIAKAIKTGRWGSLPQEIKPLGMPHPAWDRIAEETSGFSEIEDD